MIGLEFADYFTAEQGSQRTPDSVGAVTTKVGGGRIHTEAIRARCRSVDRLVDELHTAIGKTDMGTAGMAAADADHREVIRRTAGRAVWRQADGDRVEVGCTGGPELSRAVNLRSTGVITVELR